MTYQKTARASLIVWCVLTILALYLAVATAANPGVVLGLGAMSGIPLLIGTYTLAKAKGYHGAWALLSFFQVSALLILFSLPDKTAHK